MSRWPVFDRGAVLTFKKKICRPISTAQRSNRVGGDHRQACEHNVHPLSRQPFARPQRQQSSSSKLTVAIRRVQAYKGCQGRSLSKKKNPSRHIQCKTHIKMAKNLGLRVKIKFTNSELHRKQTKNSKILWFCFVKRCPSKKIYRNK